MPTFHLIPDTHVVTETCGDGLLILDIEQAHYVVLDAVGTRMWRSLQQTGDVATAAVQLHEFYEVDPALLEADVAEFADYLVRIGLASREPWTVDLPAEPPLLMSGTAEDLYLDLLTDDLLGTEASSRAPEASPSDSAEAHLVRLVRELTIEAAKADADSGAIVLPARLGVPAALIAAGVLAAHQRWSWRVRVIPDVGDHSTPGEFAELQARLRLDRLCQWGWPNEFDVATEIPALVWLPESADARSDWAALASRVVDGGLMVAEDADTVLARALIDRQTAGLDDVTPLSWRAGWWRVSGRAPSSEAPQAVDSATAAS